jgi:prophage regulatory protein
MQSQAKSLVGDALLRANQIVTSKKTGTGLLPIGPSTWWDGVRAGRFPQPVRLGRVTCWRASDIQKLIENGTAGGGS